MRRLGLAETVRVPRKSRSALSRRRQRTIGHLLFCGCTGSRTPGRPTRPKCRSPRGCGGIAQVLRRQLGRGLQGQHRLPPANLRQHRAEADADPVERPHIASGRQADGAADFGRVDAVAGRRRFCASSPGWRNLHRARSPSAGRSSMACRCAPAASPWCSRATASIRIILCATTSPSRWPGAARLFGASGTRGCEPGQADGCRRFRRLPPARGFLRPIALETN